MAGINLFELLLFKCIFLFLIFGIIYTIRYSKKNKPFYKKFGILIITIIISIMLVSAYIIIENTNQFNLIVSVDNNTSNTENIIITILDSDSDQIFNYKFSLKSEQHITLKNITNDEGRYSIFVYVDDNRSVQNNDIKVGESYSLVKIRIYDHEIEMFQEQK